MHRRIRAVSLVLAAVLVPVTGGAVQAAPTPHARLDAPAIQLAGATDREAVVRDYLQILVPAEQTSLGWRGSIEDCDAGAPSAAAQQATLDAINYYRAVSGLAPVRFDAELSQRAQQAALMMQATGALSHAPTAGAFRCWSADGAESAGRSNLYLGRTGAGAVSGYMVDPGANNAIVGHRRWILEPTTLTMGSGSTEHANALTVFGGARDAGARAPDWMPWPTAGYFPDPLEPEGRWSLSAGRDDVDFQHATVTMADSGGRPVSLVQAPISDGYGPDTISWDAAGLTGAQPGRDATYTVRVDGLRTDGGAPLPAVAYAVVLTAPTSETQQPEEPGSPDEPELQALSGSRPVIRGTARVGRTLRVADVTWSAPGVVTTYQWLRNGIPIPGATQRVRRLVPADRRARLKVRVSGVVAGFEPARLTSRATVPVRGRSRR